MRINYVNYTCIIHVHKNLEFEKKSNLIHNCQVQNKVQNWFIVTWANLIKYLKYEMKLFIGGIS